MTTTTGARSFAKMGYNGDVDTAEEDMWTVGGKYVFPTGATAMEVVSSAAGDASAGTGIQQVNFSPSNLISIICVRNFQFIL